jgi:hypothetical protein
MRFDEIFKNRRNRLEGLASRIMLRRAKMVGRRFCRTSCDSPIESDIEINTAMSLLALIFIREGHFTLPAWFWKLSSYGFNYCINNCLIL